MERLYVEPLWPHGTAVVGRVKESPPDPHRARQGVSTMRKPHGAESVEPVRAGGGEPDGGTEVMTLREGKKDKNAQKIFQVAPLRFFWGGGGGKDDKMG